jgi:hypothetical protein
LRQKSIIDYIIIKQRVMFKAHARVKWGLDCKSDHYAMIY